MVEAPTRREIRLFGFQQGREGFVRYGTAPRPALGEWADYLYLLAHGGRGSGKSKGGAYRTVHYMNTWDRSLGTITAPVYDTIHEATLPALRDALEQFGMIEGRDYEYVATREELVLYNGSKAFLRTTEKPARLRGIDGSWFWMDEPRDSPREAFHNLQATLRQQGYPHQGWLTTTPVGKQHWLYEIWHPDLGAEAVPIGEAVIAPDGVTTTLYRDDDRHIRYETIYPVGHTQYPQGYTLTIRFARYPAKTRENPHGGEAHYQQLVRTFGENSLLARQELDGEFVLMEGLTYPMWNRDVFVVPEAAWPVEVPDRVLAGVDFGFTHPFGIIVEGIDGERRRYILDEYQQSGLSEHQMVTEARRLMEKWNIRYFFCDSEDPRAIQAFRAAGLPAIRAKKRVGAPGDFMSGIGRCTRALNLRDEAGGQMFFVAPRCRQFCDQIENYVRETPKEGAEIAERPKQVGDDLVDPWRYAEDGILRVGWDAVEGVTSRGRLIPTRMR